MYYLFFFFNDPPTTDIYTLSLHDALPISDIEAERKKRDEIEAGKSYCSRRLSQSADHKNIDRKSGSAGMPRPNSYAVFCLKKKKKTRTRAVCSLATRARDAAVSYVP